MFLFQQDWGVSFRGHRMGGIFIILCYHSTRIGVSHRGYRSGSFFSGSNFSKAGVNWVTVAGSVDVSSFFLDRPLVLEGTSLPLRIKLFPWILSSVEADIIAVFFICFEEAQEVISCQGGFLFSHD